MTRYLGVTMQESSTTYAPNYEDVMQRVSDRTVELAQLAGRAPHEIRQADYERAKREIAGDGWHFGS